MLERTTTEAVAFALPLFVTLGDSPKGTWVGSSYFVLIHSLLSVQIKVPD